MLLLELKLELSEYWALASSSFCQGSLEKHACIYLGRDLLKWDLFTQLRRPRSPTIYHLQAGDLEKPGVCFDGQRARKDGVDSSLDLKAWEPESLKAEKTDVPAQPVSYFSLPLSLCSIQALSGLQDLAPHIGEDPPIQMLISSGNEHPQRHTQESCLTSYPDIP